MMHLKSIDIIIIVTYLFCMLIISWQLRNSARRNKDNYLLGGKSLSWYMLAISNASDMFDISGTIWMVSLCFVYGLKSIWIPWLWPVFNQIFMMAYLSKWLRRSNAVTGADWLTTRFGANEKYIQASHIITVIFAIISCFGFLIYGFIGLGKFVEIFIPYNQVGNIVKLPISRNHLSNFYSVIFALLAIFYSVVGGLKGIVFNDLIKYIIVAAGSICVGIVALIHLKTHSLIVPKEWLNPFFGWGLHFHWTGIYTDVNKKITDDGYSLFGIFFMMMLFKGVLASLAGPAPTYDMQKVLSTRSPEDAGKMSGLVSLILLPVRYMLITGITVLSLIYFGQLHSQISDANGVADFEKIFPAVMNTFLPAGILGLVLTGLIGSFMGNFSGTLNAAQAYIVNDIYLKYLCPNASNKKIILMNYTCGIAVVTVSIFLGCFIKNINNVIQWLVAGLFGGYIASNVLKWYWWRFNAKGFFWGMLAGIIPALLFAALKSIGIIKGLDLYYWPAILFLSLIGCVLGTYTAPATDENILFSFYTNVRPWGFWKPVADKLIAQDKSFAVNKNFKVNMLNIILGIIGQLCLTLLPMYFILNLKTPLFITTGIMVMIIRILKKTWWNKLSDY